MTNDHERFPSRWDYLTVLAGIWFLCGVYLDGWAHNHIPDLETFFTPWHAVLYSGYAASAAVLLLWTGNRKKTAASWMDAVPDGHGLTFMGAAVFLGGGVGDLLWHEIFGIEADIEALLSPTHLLLAVGAALMAGGGARRVWRMMDARNALRGGQGVVLVASLTLTLMTILFMTQFAHYTDPDYTGLRPGDPQLQFYAQAVPLMGSILFSALLAGIVSVALRRSRLPLGALTVMLTASIAGLAVMRSGHELIPAAFFAGLIGDGLLHTGTHTGRLRAYMRIVCTLVPTVYALFMVLILKQTEGVWLSVHMWTGIVVLSGITGYLVSIVAWPTPLRRLEEGEKNV